MLLAGVIDGLQFARNGGELRGTLGLDGLARLAQTPCRTSGIGYFLRGGLNPAGKASIQVRVTGRLELICQRCLEPLEFDVDVNVNLELCGDLDVIARAEDEIDRVLAEPEMCVARLVEDELILVLPLVPRHESCGVEQLLAQPRKVSPFSVLKSLKKREDR
ncbi:MAG: hypothetical protein EXR28_01290 [Betaproteobacteria bacterium]|nr:hypothetical protein [Betaproteobacteria bacterium]